VQRSLDRVQRSLVGVQPDRPPQPPPLEANDQLVTAVITAAWAIAFVVLLIVRDSLPASSRWWVWACATGLGMGLFGLWYVPRLKSSRARAAARRAATADGGSDVAGAARSGGSDVAGG
jgi:Protein of unknown function (DUF2530)